MKRYRILIASLALVSLAEVVLAQAEPGGQNPPPPRPRPDRPAQPGFRQAGLQGPLLRVLDENKDGELSEAEISNAPAALRKLDLNHDGKVTRDELRPQLPEGGDRRATGEAVVERIMSQDKNGDGKISREELPERMATNFDRLDTNKDGFIDRTEAEAMRDRVRPTEGPGGVPPRRPPPGEQN